MGFNSGFKGLNILYLPDLVKLPQFMACSGIVQKEGKSFFYDWLTVHR